MVCAAIAGTSGQYMFFELEKLDSKFWTMEKNLAS